MISFFISGHPKSTQTGSVIRAGNRLIPIRRGTAWSSICGLVARDNAPEHPLDGPVMVEMTFQFLHPKGAKERRMPAVRPDGENLIKGLCDSWNGVLYKDDAQIVDLIVKKRYGDREGVQVNVREIEEQS